MGAKINVRTYTGEVTLDTLPKLSFKEKVKVDLKRYWACYIMFLPVAAYFIIFHFIPLVGIVIAFEDFKVTKGIFKSEWVGWDNFRLLFTGDGFANAIRNTLCMGLLNLTIGFVMPIIFALIVTQIKFKGYRRVAQISSYIPHFVAAVVVANLFKEFFSSTGAMTALLSALGFPKQNWFANAEIPVFWILNTSIDLWCGLGYGSIMYVAAISTINGTFHEAAAIDGATRWQRMWHVTIPCILPIVITMLTLRIGTVFLVGFDKVLLLYMPATYVTSDCLSTFTYRMAFGTSSSYGLSSASGLFTSIMSTILLILSNYLNKKVTNISLF